MSVVAATKDHRFYEHGGPYGPGAEPVQGFLARVSGIAAGNVDEVTA